jgi:hypothetical protein
MSAVCLRASLIGFKARIYKTIDLSQWIAANPKDVLATNFGQSGCLENSRIATCSSPARRLGPDRRGPRIKTSAELATQIPSAQRGADLAQTIRVKGVGQENADADENEECRHDLGHSLPPCVAMPERARLRNSR